MVSLVLSILLVLLVIYVVPIVVYGLFSKFIGAKMPEGISPSRFLLSVLITKLGTAIAFVLLFSFAGSALSDRWLLYAFIWWVMFVVGEVGQTVGPNYSWKEALAGIISETIYLPLSAYILTQ